MKLDIPRSALHQKVFLFGLALLVCCLPLSKYLMSISLFLIALNWIIEGNLRKKAVVILQKPALVLFASVFFLYVAGLLYSQNFSEGLAKIKNALPLLLLPLIFGTSLPLSNKHIKWLLLLFSGAVLIASLLCVILYQVNGLPADGDFRKISVFMPHSRFSLMIVMTIFILLYLTFYNGYKSAHLEKSFFFICACLLIAFLFFLRSFTGIIVFVSMAMVFLLNRVIRDNRPVVRYALLIMVSGSLIALTTLLVYTYVRNFEAKPVGLSALEKLTANGNPYSHNITTGVQENGYFTDIYVCEPELKEEWDKISSIPYDHLDMKQQPISGTIKRYLTSLGLRKDSAALSKLNTTDIQHIEEGLANYKFRNAPGVYQRIYETLWEIHILTRTGFVQHHSFGQRLVFLKIAYFVIRDNLWTGVGTGDVYDSMLTQSKINTPAIDPLWVGKPHNQYIFFMLAFGIFGFLWIVWCWVYSVIRTKTYRSLLFNLFAGIILISMLTIEALESYENMVFFAFFYCLFVFGIKGPVNNKT
jgi:hypothetical protein